MAGSRPEPTVRSRSSSPGPVRPPAPGPRGPLRALILALGVLPGVLAAQTPAEPVLQGRVTVGERGVEGATVILHEIVGEAGREVDSVRTSPDGAFSLPLPRVPDPAAGNVYFASARHAGILYFGTPVSLPVQLDSAYVIEAYDTAMVVGTAGRELVVAHRNVFLEETGARWQVTDLIQVRNDDVRTLVTDSAGVVWRHALPSVAEDITLGQSDLVPGGATVAGGDLVVRAAIPPGERLFVVRYMVPDPFLEIPIDAPTEVVDVLLREPAPLVEIEGLTPDEPVELEAGSTYRRFNALEVAPGVVRVRPGRQRGRPPVEWVAVFLALALTVAGLAGALSPPGTRPAEAEGPAADDAAVLLEIARLDEEFAGRDEPDEEARDRYRRARRRLLDRLEGDG